MLNALATRVLLDEDHRAIGVEYLQGERLYRAHTPPSGEPGERRALYASREVVLAGGAFNSPQLLMLSGIGPADALRRHGIEPRVPLPGVGANLQDRYEVSVVNRMNMKAWEVYDGATFGAGDPQFAEWSGRRAGVYATNGSVLTLFKRSAPDVPVPDLFCMALLAGFQGYYPGYSAAFAKDLNALTWVVLKGHTHEPRRHRDAALGRSARHAGDRLQLLHGWRRRRRESGRGRHPVRPPRDAHAARTAARGTAKRCPATRSSSDAELAEFVRVNAWGHHACGTCAIGSPETNGVVGADFRVHHTRNLRVVDASVFPRIPGFFIVSAIYMIAEKAADVILADAARDRPERGDIRLTVNTRPLVE